MRTIIPIILLPTVIAGAVCYAAPEVKTANSGWQLKIKKLNQVISAHPQKDDAIAYRGECYKMSGNYDAALADFSKAITLNNKKPVYYHERATIYYLKKQYSSAIEDINAAIKLAPHDYSNYSYCGLLLAVSGRLTEAVAALSKAIALHPNEKDYCLRGTIYIEQNRVNEAQADLSHALQMNPTSPAAIKLKAEMTSKKKS